ncbi:hypothetical protein KIW84_025196 [Lathyrus oleraceus]|uniref:Uncharacterized protein n=1 Tax=Pisum sativum TaxID=3888 RepID=A0A9D4YJU5_PEA|nr:hypothetical protein KIW84_025196 [Pisum sativum]
MTSEQMKFCLRPIQANKVRLRIHHMGKLVSESIKWYVGGENTVFNFGRGLRPLNNDKDVLQFAKDVAGHEVMDVYMEHRVSDPHVIVDPSEIENYIDEDGVQFEVNEPDIDVSEPEVEVNEPNVSEPEVEVNEPNASEPEVEVNRANVSEPEVEVNEPNINDRNVNEPNVEVNNEQAELNDDDYVASEASGSKGETDMQHEECGDSDLLC